MDSIENGSNVDPLNSSSSDQGTSVSSASATSNIVQLISQQNAHQVNASRKICFDSYRSFPPQTHAQSSVIQPNQQSVIQTATGNIQPVKSVLLVNSKPNSVIHTTHQAIQVTHARTLPVAIFNSFLDFQIKPEPNIGHMIDSDGDDSDLSDDDSPKKRRDLLTRRPSYRKILNDLGGGEMGKRNFLPFSSGPMTMKGLKRHSLMKVEQF